MSITVTADPTFIPPRNAIDIAVPVGSLMETVSVWRTESGQATDLRAQPSSGFTTRTAYDYECPYGVEVTYGWSATYFDVSSISTVWTETWASLASWTTSGASWSVSGGKLVWTAADSTTASVTRAVTSGRYRTVFAAVPVGVATISFGGFYIDVASSRIIAGSSSVTFVPGTTTWTLDVTPTSVIITTSAGAYSVTATVVVTQIQISGPSQQLDYSSTWLVAGSPFATYGVAVDPSGYVYTINYGTSAIDKFTAAGVFVVTIGSSGTGDGQFRDPRALAFDASGNMYVADTTNNRVQKFAPPGSPTNPHTYTTKWGSSGSGDGQFSSVVGIAVDPSGNIYTCEYGNRRVQKFTNTGTFTSKFGTSGTGDGQFQGALGIVVDASGNIYVSDNTLNRVQKFNSSGVFVTKWGTSGTGNGQFDTPRDVKVDSVGNIAVIDANNYRIQFFTSAGVYIRSISGNPTFSSGLLGLAFNSAGDAYVAGSSASTSGRVTRYINRATSIDDITLSSYGGLTTLTEESAPVTLTPDDGWLIHPATPGLSFPLTAHGMSAGIRSAGDIDNESNATIHRILGSDTPVTTTNGNRAADRGSLTIAIDTRAEEIALKALLRDETPILVNIPPAMAIDFDYGFYQVGDTTRSRLEQMPNFALRDYYLPLTQVQSPIVTQQNVGWSYATVAATYSTYAVAFAAYNTYADLVTDNRNPGY